MNFFKQKLSFILTVLVFSANGTNAQSTWTYAGGNGSAGAEVSKSICTDASGNIYVTGSFNNTVDLDYGAGTANVTAAGSSDIFIASYTSTGAYRWGMRCGGARADLGVTIKTNGTDVFVFGQFGGQTCDFGSTILNSNGGGLLTDVFIMKMSASTGSISWAVNYGGTASETALNMIIDASNNIYTLNSFNGTWNGCSALVSLGSSDLVVQKLNPADGSCVWANSGGSTSGDGGSASGLSYVPASSKLVVSSSFSGPSATFGSFTLTNVNGSVVQNDIAILEMNASTGAFTNALSFGTATADDASSCDYDASTGDVVISGGFPSSITLPNSGAGITLATAGANDIWVGRYSPANHYFIWAKAAGGTAGDINQERSYETVSDGTGTIAISGSYLSTTANFGSLSLSNSSGFGQIFVAGYSAADGTELWVNSATTSAPALHSVGRGITTNFNSGTYWTTGTFCTTTTFGAQPGITSAGFADLFNAKFTAPTAPTVTTTAASSIGNTSATLGGNVTATGGATVTERGIVWSTSANPTIADTKVANGSGTGSFSGTVSSLPSGTLIHFRAYGTSSAGTGYGSDLTFTTTSATPEINVQGNGNSIVDGDATPNATDHSDFGSQSVCSGSIVRTFTIQNTGTANLTLSNPTLSGTNAADFSITANPSTPVAAAGSTTFQVTFNPSATGTRTATVSISSNDSDEATYDFAIQGMGTDPEINVQGNGNSIADGDATPTSTDHTDFGSQDMCSGTIVRTFTIQNTGNANLNLANPTLSGTNAADFSITANPSTPVSAAGSTTFQVTFNPSASGTRMANVSFTSDDCDEATYDFAIQGTGLDGTPNADAPSNVTACDSYELPPLTVGNYFTGSGGTGTALSAGNMITSSQTIYVYAVNGSCTDENSFTVTINTTLTADAPSNVTACDSYELPPLTVGNYFTGSGGTGTALSAGNFITSSQTIYVYAETGTTPNCTDENSFLVTINTTPTADAPSNVTACDSYELPPLTVGNYFTGSGGTGTALSAGNFITSTQTIYVYAETGTTPNCSDENSFLVTINTTPTADAPSNVTACDSYELPPLTVGNYFTGSGGTGTALSAGNMITSTQTIYVYAETGTTPNCTDENSFVVTVYDCSKLAGVSCGKTLATMDETLNSEAVAGATNYRYWVQHASGYSQVSTRGVADNLFRMSWLTTPLKYGTTYTVRVSAFVGGSWQPYGDVCNVTTPATKLTNSYCGIVLNSISDVVYSYPVQGATNYRYRVENTTSGFLKVSTRGAANNEFSLGWFSSGVETGRVYNVQVSAYVAGSWQPYGAVCTLTTPVPLTQLKAASCNVNIPTLSTALYSEKVTGATNYRYEVVNVGAGFSKVSTRNAADTLFRLSWVSGIQLNTTYTIRVAAYINNVWGAYSTACTVTTPAAIMADEEVVQEYNNGLSLGEELVLEAFPNPNSGNFTLRSNTAGRFQLTNELGQVIRNIEISEETNYQATVEGLSQGVYFINTKKIVVQ